MSETGNVALPTGLYISLFAGVGGLDIGLRIASSETRCVCSVEINREAAEVLAARSREGSTDDAPVWSDVRTFPSELFRGKVDGIIGGFPCTDLSVAGKQAGIYGEHSGLWFEYLRIIREVQPRWVIIENVPAVIAVPAGGIVLGGLAEAGFDAEWLSLRASDVGASHGRLRVFILAYSRCSIIRQPEQREYDSMGRKQHTNILFPSVAHPEQSRQSATGSRRTGEPEPGCGDVGHATSHGQSGEWQGSREQPSEAGRSSTFDELGNSDEPGLQRWRERGHGTDEWASGEAGNSELADTESPLRQQVGRGRSGSVEALGREKKSGHVCEGMWESIDRDRSSADCRIYELPLFAPGPGATELWQSLLVSNPELRPAISQAETQQLICNLDDELAAALDSARTDALRACGNGVVALQAATAITILAGRII